MKDQGGVMLEVEEGPGFREEEGEEDGSEAEGSWTDEDEEEARLQAGRGVELDARQRGATPVVPPAPAPSENGKAPAGKGKAPERKVSRAEAIIEDEGYDYMSSSSSCLIVQQDRYSDESDFSQVEEDDDEDDDEEEG